MEPPSSLSSYSSQVRQTGFYPGAVFPNPGQPTVVLPKGLNPKIIKIGQLEFTFQIGNITARTAARLRQILMGEIPIMAIDCVEIYKNTSILQDEILAQRLGLIPLTSSNITWLPFSRGCDCDCPDQLPDCSKCSVILHLRVTGDKQKFPIVEGRRRKFISVTSQNIMPENRSYQIKPVEYRIPDSNGGTIPGAILLARLQEGQELQIRCIAKKGIGADHSKFSSVAGVFFDETETGDIIFTVGITGALSPKEVLEELVRIYSSEKLI
uniref:RPB3 subunit of eukaryotic RNA polymerase II n=1 Tax=Pithovirus LCPAC201 TaxID=2506591 RepID=A0A481Z4X0_9VIRU|nr:MAG: RPB3 subunit of eukaryotic RNA polymerase II [Pithovirus LCPAC201]